MDIEYKNRAEDYEKCGGTINIRFVKKCLYSSRTTFTESLNLVNQSNCNQKHTAILP